MMPCMPHCGKVKAAWRKKQNSGCQVLEVEEGIHCKGHLLYTSNNYKT